MEKPTNETQLALIQKDLTYMKVSIDDVKSSLKEMKADFATKEELNNVEQTLESRIKGVKDETDFLKKGMWGAIAFILYEIGHIVFSFISREGAR